MNSFNAHDIFAHWSLDYMGPFPKDVTTNAENVLLGVDFLSRWVETEPCENADADHAALFMYQNIVTRYGTPESIQSDNATHFINRTIKALNKMLLIEHKRLTPYYPQSNGRTERVVGTIKSMIKSAMAELDNKSNWSPTLYASIWTYQSTLHRILGVSPAEVVFGHRIRIPSDPTDSDMRMISQTDEEHKELVARRLKALAHMISRLREARLHKHEMLNIRRFLSGI